MATLHEERQTGPGRPPRSEQVEWLFVLGVVVVVGALAVTLALVLGGRDRDAPSGSGTVRGSGAATSETRSLPEFTGLELAGSNRVTVQVGAPQSVTVHADDNLIGHVSTTVRSGTLVIDTSGSISTRTPMRVSVVVPTLTSVTLSGSGTIVVDGVESAAFTAGLPGSGTVQVTGRTEQLQASLEGSGQLALQGLTARAVELRLSGSGEIRVHAVDSLDVDLSGSGSVRYAGDPAHVTRTITGSGTVQPE